METGDANRSRGLHHRVVRVVALGDAAFALEKQRVRAGDAVVLRGTGAGFAGRMAGVALGVLVVLIAVAVAAAHGRAHTLLVQAPAVDAAGAAQRGAGRAAGRTRHALASLLVRAVASRTRGATRACECEKREKPCDSASAEFARSRLCFIYVKLKKKKKEISPNSLRPNRQIVPAHRLTQTARIGKRYTGSPPCRCRSRK